jgi:cytochrome oxidase Cu insertion factor (SCO1/SenC/PrrC family)
MTLPFIFQFDRHQVRIMTMSNRTFSFMHVALIFLLLLIAIPVTGFGGELQQPKIGEAAPAFNLDNLQGENVVLANLLGKFVVIHFATSW